MQLNLRGKIVLIVFLVLIAAIGTNILVNSTNFRDEYSEALKRNTFTIGESLRNQLERLLSLNIALNDLLDYDAQCREVIRKYPMILFVAVTDLNGKILYHSDSTVQDNQYCNKDLIRKIKEQNDNVITYKENNHKFYGFTIIIRNNESLPTGAIILSIPEQVINEKVFSSFISSLIISFSFLMISILLIVWAISKWVTTPLKELDRATHTIITNGTESFTKIPLRSHDEIGRLSDSFNKMAEELKLTTVSKAYMDKIISCITDGLFVIDSNLIIKTVNDASCKMLNYTQEELIGKPITNFFNSDHVGPFKTESSSIFLQNRVLYNHESIFVKRAGDRFPVLLSCSIMENAAGKIRSIVLTVKDITERKLIEKSLITQTKKLTRSNAEMQEFIYIASHDLQEPLRKVCAFSDRVIAKYGSVIDEQGQDYLKRIQNAGVRMQTRIDDLLSYSRVTTKAQTFNKINLNQIAIEVISDLQIRIEQTSGQVIVDKLIEIEAEPTQMRQLFQNMIGNALKFHRKDVPPVVKVYASIKTDPNADPWQTDTESCILTFEDNGIGIEEQYFQKIFVVFQRLHGKDQYEGTGVGLAICQKIVEYHNGEITVESTPEIGTKFIITLPIKQKKALEG